MPTSPRPQIATMTTDQLTAWARSLIGEPRHGELRAAWLSRARAEQDRINLEEARSAAAATHRRALENAARQREVRELLARTDADLIASATTTARNAVDTAQGQTELAERMVSLSGIELRIARNADTMRETHRTSIDVIQECVAKVVRYAETARKMADAVQSQIDRVEQAVAIIQVRGTDRDALRPANANSYASSISLLAERAERAALSAEQNRADIYPLSF